MFGLYRPHNDREDIVPLPIDPAAMSPAERHAMGDAIQRHLKSPSVVTRLGGRA